MGHTLDENLGLVATINFPPIDTHGLGGLCRTSAFRPRNPEEERFGFIGEGLAVEVGRADHSVLPDLMAPLREKVFLCLGRVFAAVLEKSRGGDFDIAPQVQDRSLEVAAAAARLQYREPGFSPSMHKRATLRFDKPEILHQLLDSTDKRTIGSFSEHSVLPSENFSARTAFQLKPEEHLRLKDIVESARDETAKELARALRGSEYWKWICEDSDDHFPELARNGSLEMTEQGVRFWMRR